MTWTSPMTAVSGSVFTAAQFNLFVRDNLLETAPAQAFGPNGLIVTDGANSVVQRTPAFSFVDASTSITSTTFDIALDGNGPFVNAFTGTAALVWITMQASNNTAGSACKMSISNVGTTVPGDSSGLTIVSPVANNAARATIMHHVTGMAVGANQFEALYRVTGNTGTASMRRVEVLPL